MLILAGREEDHVAATPPPLQVAEK